MLSLACALKPRSNQPGISPGSAKRLTVIPDTGGTSVVTARECSAKSGIVLAVDPCDTLLYHPLALSGLATHMSERIRLLHIFPAFAIGGAQVRLTQIINHSPDDGISHHIMSLLGEYTAEQKIAPGKNVHRVTPAVNSSGLFSRIRRMRRQLREIAPDGIMTYNWGAIEWAAAGSLLTDIPVLHWEDGFGPEEQSHRLLRRNLFRTLALWRARQVFVPSRGLERIARREWHIPRERLRYFPNGVELPPRPPPVLPRHPGRIVLGTLASLRREKDIPFMVAALAALPDHVHLRIAGTGPEQAAIEREIASHGLDQRVELVGYVGDVWGFLDSLDALCLSSTTEQMPISVLEAMAAGLPVVSTDVGDVAEMVSPENRALVVSRADYATALAAFVGQTDTWSSIGAANRRRVAGQYTLDDMAQRFGQAVADATAGR